VQTFEGFLLGQEGNCFVEDWFVWGDEYFWDFVEDLKLFGHYLSDV